MRDYISELCNTAREHGVFSSAGILRDFATDRTAVRTAVNDFVSGLLASDPRAYDKIGSKGSLILNANDPRSDLEYFVELSTHRPGTTASVSSHVIQSILTPVNAAIEIEEYSLPDNWNSAVYDPTAKVISKGKFILNPGEVLEVHAHNVAYAFNFHKPTAIMKLQWADFKHQYEWSFDRATGLPFQMIAAHSKASYLQHLCAVARDLADPSCVPGLEPMLDFPAHDIRWAAAQALGAISREKGISALQRLANDAHPHVRASAQKVLEQIQ